MARQPVTETKPKPHRCVLPKDEHWSTPQNDRECHHKPGDKVVCDEGTCGRVFGRACKKCNFVV